MSKVEEYRKKTRKKIVTPGGLELEIRKLKALDYLKLGILPDTLAELKNAKDENLGVIDPEILEKLHKMYLTRAIIPQKDLVIVDKSVVETMDNEISFLELTDEDSNFIIKEIMDLSFDPELESPEDMSPFPEEPVSDID